MTQICRRKGLSKSWFGWSVYWSCWNVLWTALW